MPLIPHRTSGAKAVCSRLLDEAAAPPSYLYPKTRGLFQNVSTVASLLTQLLKHAAIPALISP
jgi:hypothetical protein